MERPTVVLLSDGDFALSLLHFSFFVIYRVFVPVRQFIWALFIASLAPGLAWGGRGRGGTKNAARGGLFVPAVRRSGKSKTAQWELAFHHVYN